MTFVRLHHGKGWSAGVTAKNIKGHDISVSVSTNDQPTRLAERQTRVAIVWYRIGTLVVDVTVREQLPKDASSL